MSTFKVLLANEVDGKPEVEFVKMEERDLPDGEVLIDVSYSALNYKDGLALNGNLGKVMRKLPMVPGIDLSGTVLESRISKFQEGERVFITGGGLSEVAWGGYAQRARVKSDWLLHVPEALDLKQVMAIGTAGVTAMLSIMALEDTGLKASDKPILVTGAAGGVGSLAVAILSTLGYSVTASTGRPEAHQYLNELGAKDLITRSDLARDARPLESEKWGSVVDTVGSTTLATVLAQVSRFGSIAVCGNAGGNSLTTTVLPMILRGVNLLGIDSVYCPLDRRSMVWERLTKDLNIRKLDSITQVIGFSDLLIKSKKILEGGVRGRVVVDLSR